jgi:hypothetical protein
VEPHARCLPFLFLGTPSSSTIDPAFVGGRGAREEVPVAATKDDVMLLLKLDEVHKPSVEAKKFAYSAELAEAVAEGDFFDRYTLDSDERMYVNQIATYFELLGGIRSRGVVDDDLALSWAGAAITWERVGPVLVQAREVFGSDKLWTDFEALAAAQSSQPDG